MVINKMAFQKKCLKLKSLELLNFWLLKGVKLLGFS